MERLDLFFFNIGALFSGQYSPLCMEFPAWFGQLMAVSDLQGLIGYTVVGFAFHAMAGRMRPIFPALSSLLYPAAGFVFFCGFTHATGWLAELALIIWPDVFVTLAMVAMIYVAIWRGCSKYSQVRKELSDASALAKAAPRLLMELRSSIPHA